MEELSTARQIIEHSDYAEYPETITHAKLCVAMARLDGRSITKSLREFSRRRAEVVTNNNLKKMLTVMSRSMFPEADISKIKNLIRKMESVLARELEVRIR